MGDWTLILGKDKVRRKDAAENFSQNFTGKAIFSPYSKSPIWVETADMKVFKENEPGTVMQPGYLSLLYTLGLTKKYSNLYDTPFEGPYESARAKVYQLELSFYDVIKNFYHLKFTKDQICCDTLNPQMVKVFGEENFSAHDDSYRFVLSGKNCVDQFISTAIEYSKQDSKTKND